MSVHLIFKTDDPDEEDRAMTLVRDALRMVGAEVSDPREVRRLRLIRCTDT